jgi:hypothetical protein
MEILMKKKEANDEIVSNFEEDWFDEDTFDEQPDMDVMVEFLKLRSSTALELTKLVLQYCKNDKLSKKDVFSIFYDAIQATEKCGDLENTLS